MGLLRLLGIEKYLKKVKTYVDEENVKDRAYTDKKVSENKAATPDWDAESWEAGHIKNRTHGLTDLTVLTKSGETAYGMLETQYLKIQDELFPISRGETVILRQGPHISVTYENGQLTLNDPEDFAESLGGVIVAIGINRISEHYIPDTIARKSDLTNVAASDWNAAEGQSGHIKNRTHYSRNIILQSNESNGKYTYYLDFYESDDTTAAWLSFYDITESRTREISLSELNGFGVDLGYAQITFFLMYDSNEGAYYVLIESNTGTVDSRIVDSIAIQAVDKPLNQGFIPKTFARQADVEDLISRIDALEAEVYK